MKSIGLIGGMSWESTEKYYRLINTMVKQRLGGHHSARCLLYSVDFAELQSLQHRGGWQEVAACMISAAQSLERGGADFIILCTNTMHKVAEAIEHHTAIPFLHIADVTARAIQSAGFKKVGLLGTKFTMEEDFYRGRLSTRHNIAVAVPSAPDREIIHHVIFEELCHGIIKEASRQEFVRMISGLTKDGAEGIVLGCTEIGMLVHDSDVKTPLFDTTTIHAEAAVEYALS